jgi:hypothetical protein
MNRRSPSRIQVTRAFNCGAKGLRHVEFQTESIKLTFLLHRLIVQEMCYARGAQRSGAVARATKVSTLAPNIYGSSVRSSLHVILLVPRILRWIVKFGKFVHPCTTLFFFYLLLLLLLLFFNFTLYEIIT